MDTTHHNQTFQIHKIKPQISDWNLNSNYYVQMQTMMSHVHRKKVVVAPLTEEELDAITIVFHQFETGLREGTIYTKVCLSEICIGVHHVIICFISTTLANCIFKTFKNC